MRRSTQPSVGQEGKDVIWVPTPDSLIEAMLDLAKVTPDDYVMDLGSGDGRIVIAAAKRGARAIGFEFNPDMVDAVQAKRGEGGSLRQSNLCECRYLRKRFQQGHRYYDVPSAAAQS